MTQSIPVTTTIKSDLWNYVKSEAKSRKLKYNSILEEAIRNYKKERLREEIKKAYTDPERQEESRKIASEMANVRASNLDSL